MSQNNPFSVRVERPAEELGSVMKEIRTWLDTQKIQPTGFKSDTQAANVALEINFASEDEARRFQSTFGHYA